MSRFKLDRRTVIKGAGTIAIALPWLEVMGHGRRASAQTARRAAEAVRDRVSAGRNGPQRRDRRQVHAHGQRDVVHAVADPGAARAGQEQPARRRRPQHDLRRPVQVRGRAAPGRSVGWLTGAIQPGRATIRSRPSIDQVLADEAVDRQKAREPRVRRALGDREVARQDLVRSTRCTSKPGPADAASAPRSIPQDIFTDAVRQLTRPPTPTGPDVNAIALHAQEVDPRLRRQEVRRAEDEARRGRPRAARSAPDPDPQPRAADRHHHDAAAVNGRYLHCSPSKVDTTGYNPTQRPQLGR